MTDQSQHDPDGAHEPVSQVQFQEALGMIAAAFERTATKDELTALAARVDDGFERVETRFERVDDRLAQIDSRFGQLAEQLAQDKRDIIFQFQALAENIHQDLAGANRDEISLIHDRFGRIERHLGLTTSR